MTTWERDAGAIVIGGDYKSLGVVRSLGRHGIPVWVLRDDHTLATFSRYCRRTLPWPQASETQQVEYLRGLASAHGLDGWTIFPGGEEAAIAGMVEHLPTHEQFLNSQTA